MSDHEDSTIYTNEMRDLRDRLRKNGGWLPCLNCERKVTVDFSGIERQIRKNRNSAGFGMGELVFFQPDWGSGSICKNCDSLLCGPCSKEAHDPMWGMPLCPNCGQPVQGIDHITD